MFHVRKLGYVQKTLHVQTFSRVQKMTAARKECPTGQIACEPNVRGLWQKNAFVGPKEFQKQFSPFPIPPPLLPFTFAIVVMVVTGHKSKRPPLRLRPHVPSLPFSTIKLFVRFVVSMLVTAIASSIAPMQRHAATCNKNGRRVQRMPHRVDSMRAQIAWVLAKLEFVGPKESPQPFSPFPIPPPLLPFTFAIVVIVVTGNKSHWI